MSSKKRHQARLYAMQAIYSWDIARLNIQDIENDFLAHQNQSKFDAEYFSNLIHQVTANVGDIDTSLSPHIQERTIEEVGPIEKAILRVAVCEMKFHIDQVPCRVIINEAIELAKQFGADDAHSFVNGILDPLAKSMSLLEPK